LIQNRKKAFIDQIMLGFFLIAFSTIFIGTISDEFTARTKYTELKKVLQTTVLTASKYYLNEEENEAEAENIALSLIEQIPLGAEVKENIVFEWDFTTEPNSVIATISEYREEFFWFKLLDFHHIDFTNISAKANMITQALESTDDFIPIAVNGCTQTLDAGTNHNFLLKAYDLYDENDNVGFFALYEPSGGQSSFAHFKNIVKDVMRDRVSNFNINNDVISISTVLAINISNDVKQISKAFGISSFSGKDMSIAVLDCGSTADNPIIKELLPIHMNQVYCGSCCSFMGFCMPFPMSMMCKFFDMLQDVTGDVFSDIIWATTVNSCNHNKLFRINFDILNNHAQIVLEY